MSELKLSERIRVELAVNGEIVIGRGTAVPLIKALEAMESDADRCNMYNRPLRKRNLQS